MKIYKSRSVDEMFKILEDDEVLYRLDKNIQPGRFRCATVTLAEMNLLRKVEIIRHGRVKEVTENSIIFNDNNIININYKDLLIDCTADGLAPKPSIDIWNKNNIILQSVSMCQQV